jgi:hypothetical protein
MTKSPTDSVSLNADFLDMIEALQGAGARFLVVGAHAMAAHGVPRATGDFDIFVESSADNARRIRAALIEFGAPLQSHGITEEDFQAPGLVYQIGLPPRRIDLITSIDALDFEEAWIGRIEIDLLGVKVPVIGRAELIKNKLATGREKDRVDVRLLQAQI